MNNDLLFFRICFTDGVGPKSFVKLHDWCGGNYSRIFDGDPEQISKGAGVRRDLLIRICSDTSLNQAEKIMQCIRDYRISYVRYGDPAYPRRLCLLSDPPPFLFYQGDMRVPEHTVAIVGTRNPSASALFHAKKISSFLSKNGIGVISGFARGVDQAVHRSCVESGGWTAAVLGSGIRNIYPDEYTSFAHRISETGLLCSEFDPFAQARPSSFPRRNRIIAALSDAVIVVEAAAKSGSLITAGLAGDIGKEILVVPLAPSMRTEGSNQLIKEGAACVTKPEEVFQIMGWKLNQPDQEGDVFRNDRLLKAFAEHDILSTEEIAEFTEMDIASILSRLTELEGRGYVESLPSQLWAVKTGGQQL